MKNTKVYTYLEFLKENMHDTPETYVESALKKLKSRIEKMFAHDEVSNGEIKKVGEVSDNDKKSKGMMSFKDLNVTLETIELSKYSKVYDNLKVIFADEQFRYDLIITIDLKEAISEDEDKDFKDSDIKKCFIKFKKYDTENFELKGQISKTANISDIDEEFLINLRIEVDEDGGGEEEEFSIET